VSKLTERPGETWKEMRTLTREQASGTLLPALAEDRLFAAVLLVFGTGLRRGELLALRWRGVDLNEGLLYIRRTLVRIRNYDGGE
jgi:integrase